MWRRARAVKEALRRKESVCLVGAACDVHESVWVLRQYVRASAPDDGWRAAAAAPTVTVSSRCRCRFVEEVTFATIKVVESLRCCAGMSQLSAYAVRDMNIFVISLVTRVNNIKRATGAKILPLRPQKRPQRQLSPSGRPEARTL